jgi:hypothetical protein
MQNLDINICNKVHSLFLANKGLTMVQEEKVEQFGKANATPNVFDFSNRNGVLFEWNDKVD